MEHSLLYASVELEAEKSQGAGDSNPFQIPVQTQAHICATCSYIQGWCAAPDLAFWKH